MPPRSPAKAAVPLTTSSDTPLPLPALLLSLTTSGPRPPHLSMSQAMSLAGKLVPKGYTSPAKLRTLTGVDLARLGVDDEEVRKGFLAVIGKKSGTGAAKGPATEKGKGKKKVVDPFATEEDGQVGGKRKRPRDSDLDQPLPSRKAAAEAIDADFDFEEIEVEEALLKKTVMTNRAPVMTAWAFVVAERLGFRRQEALSIAHVFTDMNASSKGVSLGIMSPDAAKVEVGPSQPFVDILGRKVPVLSSQNGEWRAISKGLVADPAKAFSYVRSAFRQQMGAVVGSLRLLAASFPREELNKKGYGLYLEFRPEVEGWGKKGEVRMETILGLRRFLTHPDADQRVKGEGEGLDGGQVVEDGVGVVKEEAATEGEEGVGPDRKKVKAEEGFEEDAKPDLWRVKKDEAAVEVDEFDALDEGIDYDAIEL
ncbi:hypothetical protein JCM11251_007175 [Rhodosporidiobolus azoricus]